MAPLGETRNTRALFRSLCVPQRLAVEEGRLAAHCCALCGGNPSSSGENGKKAKRRLASQCEAVCPFVLTKRQKASSPPPSLCSAATEERERKTEPATCLREKNAGGRASSRETERRTRNSASRLSGEKAGVRTRTRTRGVATLDRALARKPREVTRKNLFPKT